MSSNEDAAAPARRLLASARALYQNLHGELAKSLTTISTDENEAAARRAETIRSHRKALQSVLDIEFDMMRREGRTGLGDELDLEAARDEVYRRLDRLAAAG